MEFTWKNYFLMVDSTLFQKNYAVFMHSIVIISSITPSKLTLMVEGTMSWSLYFNFIKFG